MNTASEPRAAEFRYSPVKTMVMALFAAILTFGPLIGAFGPGVPLGFRVILLCASAFFGVWLAAMLKRFGERQVIVALAPDGIYDKRIGPRLIPWSAIEQVYVFRARSQMYLAVVLIHPERYIDPPTAFDRFAMWANNTIGLPKASVSMTGLDGSMRTIMTALRDVVPRQIAGEPRKIGMFSR